MSVRFLLGPAGTGKTFRCVSEIRELLSRAPEGPPLILLAPNQTTYQLERQIMSSAAVPGFTRLHILSFERLAYLLLEWFRHPAPELLQEEGRVMVLRALLSRKHTGLKLFRASARLTGFAQELSTVLREFQQHGFSPDTLEQLAARMGDKATLSFKLLDLAALLREYLNWLAARGLQDNDCLLGEVAKLLKGPQNTNVSPLGIEGLWVDGFTEFTSQELDLLAALLPQCGRVTISFCLDAAASLKVKKSWLSAWSVTGFSFEKVRNRLAEASGRQPSTETLSRQEMTGRFAQNRVLGHLEQHWADPKPFGLDPDGGMRLETAPYVLGENLRAVACKDPSAEVRVAAREIMGWVQQGGRFRDIAVLVRDLQPYQHHVQNVFARYGIPFFLDKRQSMSHHPIAELTRSALRTAALGWQTGDWFAALKTGLVPAADAEIDRLENEALARGWTGSTWQQPLRIREQARTPDDAERLRRLETELEALRLRIIEPFLALAAALRRSGSRPTGLQLAQALRDFWETLSVPAQIESWPDDPSEYSEQLGNSVHQTVWTQINAWVENIELAFADEPLPIREWLPILETGLANLTVGLIPPALDQVLVGTVDRSRNPEPRLALVLGMNESVFPAAPAPGGLLTEADREVLDTQNALPGCSARQHLGREAYFGYLACTRAKDRVVLSWASHDEHGTALNPSPFLRRIRRLFPALVLEAQVEPILLEDSTHPLELMESLLAAQAAQGTANGPEAWASLQEAFRLAGITSLGTALQQLQNAQARCADPGLAPAIAARLYGPVLRTSVSRIEQFAACPFKFFVHSGLRAQERRRFELDSREQGNFLHEVLALFHAELRKENKNWRDVTPQEARRRVANIATALVAGYREGVLSATEKTRFVARSLTESVQDFVEVLVGWTREQYHFNPVAVELPFGGDEHSPAWCLELPSGERLELYGRIDRVDLLSVNGHQNEALCVVVDYKSGQHQLEPLMIAHGLQLQLLAYLNVLRHWPDPASHFGVSRLVPAGVFYVHLRGKGGFETNRSDALRDSTSARKLAYRHAGRFDASVLRHLDSRPHARQGDQFNYRLTQAGVLHQNCREPMPASAFEALLSSVERNLRRMAREIYAGVARVSPYRKGTATACDRCEYQSICRIDPWTHHYRVLDKHGPPGL